jgi:hypothetical protein
MAVEAQSGATRKDLHTTIKAALTAWPGESEARNGRKVAGLPRVTRQRQTPERKRRA